MLIPLYIRYEFPPDERSFVQFSRRCTEYRSNGLVVHEAYVYFMTLSATGADGGDESIHCVTGDNDISSVITPLCILES